MTDPATNTTLLLDLNMQIGDMRSDLGKLIAGLGHVVERQKDFSSDVSKIESRLEDGSKRHSEFAATLAGIDVHMEMLSTVPATINGMKDEMAKIAPLGVTVGEMKPQVKELMDFKTRMAGIIVATSMIIGTATWFAWEGIKWFFPDAKSLIGRLFH